MLELFATTGDERFRVGAEGAFAYERSWATADSGAWPDLRSGGHRRGSERRSPSPIAGSWCHGEAGIALTRMRATEVLGRDPYEAEAISALAITRRELNAAIPYELEDATICHGAAGSADVLLSAGDYDIAAELGHAALERYAPTGRWPCGLLGGTTPALYRGLTGIGWFYLRLHDPTTPSPLALPLRLTAPTSGRRFVSTGLDPRTIGGVHHARSPPRRVRSESESSRHQARGPAACTGSRARSRWPLDVATARIDGPESPERRSFVGYLGRTFNHGVNMDPAVRRLGPRVVADHRDERHRRSRTIPPDAGSGTPEALDIIWVLADAAVGRGGRSLSVEGAFLCGNFTRAGDFEASPTGGTLAASTGVFCEARSPGCCKGCTANTR